MRVDAFLIDAGTGNLHSVYNALVYLGYRIQMVSEPEALQQGGRVIFPGVGAFGAFMAGLKARGLEQAVVDVARRGDPLLGICVGMQAFFDSSEERGHFQGLGLLPGAVKRFPACGGLKVPQTGWNELCLERPSALFNGLPAGSYAYFNHSYYCDAAPQDALALTDYGIHFASAVQHDNIYGVQFHPEKSQRVGRLLLNNFLHL